MPKWELTDEEILAVDSPGRDEGLLEALYDSFDDDGKALLLRYHKALIQAGAKRLVEWGDEDCMEHSKMESLGVALEKRWQCHDCREQLRSQVGLEGR